jgi:hypothetical protein
MDTAVKRPAGETRGKVAAGPKRQATPPRQPPTLQRISFDAAAGGSREKLFALGPALIVPGMAPLSGRPSLALP